MTSTHRVEWTDAKVGAFWKANHALFSRRRFSQQVGPALRELIFSETQSRGGRILDYGCGDGALIRRLIDQQTLLLGTDFERPEGFAALPASLQGASAAVPYFASAEQLSALEGSMDAVLLIEVVEHLDDANLAKSLEHCRRLLRPGGRLVITTPHDEDLNQNTVNCPDCGCIFHRVQHVRSWQAESLGRFVAGTGLRPRHVFVTDLGRMQRRWISRMVHTLVDRLDRRKMPHLVGVFEKA